MYVTIDFLRKLLKTLEDDEIEEVKFAFSVAKPGLRVIDKNYKEIAFFEDRNSLKVEDLNALNCPGCKYREVFLESTILQKLVEDDVFNTEVVCKCKNCSRFLSIIVINELRNIRVKAHLR